MRIYGEKNWGRKTLPQGNSYASRGVSHHLICNELEMNNLLQMLMGMWSFSGMKEKLVQLWVPQERLQNVNFSDLWSLNQLAQEIMPWLLANNKELAGKIKGAASMLGADKQKEVSDIIDVL